MSFSRIEEIKLIKSVKHYSALYDPRDKEYKESRKRRKMWDDIASHFKGRTDKDCKNRWRSIRDTYKRLKREGKVTEENIKSKRSWPLVEHLSFIDDVLEIRAKRSQNSQYSDNEDEENQEIIDVKTEHESVMIYDDGSLLTNYYEEDALSNSTNMTSLPSSSTSQSLTTFNYDQDNEIDMFYRSIALSVKKLPPFLIAEVKLKHLQILTELEMKVGRSKNFANNDVS